MEESNEELKSRLEELKTKKIELIERKQLEDEIHKLELENSNITKGLKVIGKGLKATGSALKIIGDGTVNAFNTLVPPLTPEERKRVLKRKKDKKGSDLEIKQPTNDIFGFNSKSQFQ